MSLQPIPLKSAATKVRTLGASRGRELPLEESEEKEKKERRGKPGTGGE